MSYRVARALLPVLSLLLPTAAIAAADLIPVEDFARHAQLSMPRLSPSGEYLAVRMDDNANGDHALAVYRVSDMLASNMERPLMMLRLPKYELPVNTIWVSPTRLIVEKGKQFGSIDIPMYTGEIVATDIDGKNQDYLYGYDGTAGKRAGTRARDRGFGSVAGLPEPTNDHFYLGVHLWGNDQSSSLYDVDATKNTRHLIGDIGVARMRFMVGADGQAHYAYGENNDYDYVVYHREGNAWAKLDTRHTGKTFAPISFTPDHQRIYALQSDAGGPSTLIEQDEQGGQRRTLAKDDFGSISHLQWTPLPLQPFAATTATGLPKLIYFDTNQPAAKLHMALSQKFPGLVSFINYSEDGKQLLFSVSSDREPGTYYLIDTTHFKVSKLFAGAPWIDPAKMAERRPLRFKASDGLELEAILTLPPGRNESNLPMVLLPHGGPHGIEDNWFYDNDAQFLANRGYLVLQVNYRGSGGRGGNFKEAGYLKWGTRVQQDLIDGVKWAISENYADPKRICVFGASFGGYSAMMTTIRAPELFKCAVGYAGIYDLAMMYKKGDIGDNKFGRSYLNTVIGKDDADLAANSPVKLADKINIPVLLIHGEDDQRAPFAQAKAMRAALEAAHKPYEWLSKPGEGHGFYDEKNNVEFFNTLQTFLAKHIGEGASR
ncbi:alpha/beta hydrolase family protein [Dyella tabacisoli]|uniref:S9 family peptidase n=1 Tax=Dyella tabacisoli TaxID=2282381 RepID=A0A369UQZ5_9GAMM|nr:S9 family peptidase [Dyella tabacisoli]RDD82475.1 S9 family peptidase [Dyella tabacisoli]